MKFGVIGISYQKTSIQKREGASFSDTQKLQLYDELLDSKILQAMSCILSMKKSNSCIRRSPYL